MGDAITPDRNECRQATWAYSLYLLNLSFLPGLAFVLMLLLWRRHHRFNALFAATHFRHAIIGSVCAGILLAIVSAIIVAIGGLNSPWTLVVLLLYFTLCHSVLLLLGVIGFTRANNGKPFRFLTPATWRS